MKVCRNFWSFTRVRLHYCPNIFPTILFSLWKYTCHPLNFPNDCHGVTPLKWLHNWRLDAVKVHYWLKVPLTLLARGTEKLKGCIARWSNAMQSYTSRIVAHSWRTVRLLLFPLTFFFVGLDSPSSQLSAGICDRLDSLTSELSAGICNRLVSHPRIHITYQPRLLDLKAIIKQLDGSDLRQTDSPRGKPSDMMYILDDTLASPVGKLQIHQRPFIG